MGNEEQLRGTRPAFIFGEIDSLLIPRCRLLYYSAYLAEEIGREDGYTVAPGCVGTRIVGADKRCTFKEFMLHIWKEHVTLNSDGTPKKGAQDNKPPTSLKFELPSGFDFTKEAPSKNAWRQTVITLKKARTDKGFPITGNSDNTKLLPGSTDWYDALKEIGKPIEVASEKLEELKLKPDDPKYLAGKTVLDNAKDSARIVVDTRRADMEKYRIGALNEQLKLLGTTSEVKTKPGRNTNAVAGGYQMLDIDETMKDPVLKDKIPLAYASWASSGDNPNHLLALESAEGAQKNCGCT